MVIWICFWFYLTNSTNIQIVRRQCCLLKPSSSACFLEFLLAHFGSWSGKSWHWTFQRRVLSEEGPLIPIGRTIWSLFADVRRCWSCERRKTEKCCVNGKHLLCSDDLVNKLLKPTGTNVWVWWGRSYSIEIHFNAQVRWPLLIFFSNDDKAALDHMTTCKGYHDHLPPPQYHHRNDHYPFVTRLAL